MENINLEIFLTVIISTRNRSRSLEGVLASLCEQTCPRENFEVIVVDNGSIDDTAHVCTLYESRLKNFKVIFDERPGLHIGRHLGLKHAKGETLVYTDDDIIATPGWLEAISSSFKNQDVALVGGKIMPDYEMAPPEWVDRLWTENEYGRCLGYFSLIDLGDKIREIPATYVYGCNFAIRKSVLIETGGFHPDSMPQVLARYRGDGETAVSTAVDKMGLKTVYNPRSAVYHRVSGKRLSLDYIKQRAFNQGVSDSFTDIRERSGKTVVDGKAENLHCPKVFANKRLHFGNVKLLLKRIMLPIKNTLSFVLEKDNVLRQASSAYRSGYLFHQMEVARDPDLFLWVVKRDYFV